MWSRPWTLTSKGETYPPVFIFGLSHAWMLEVIFQIEILRDRQSESKEWLAGLSVPRKYGSLNGFRLTFCSSNRSAVEGHLSVWLKQEGILLLTHFAQDFVYSPCHLSHSKTFLGCRSFCTFCCSREGKERIETMKEFAVFSTLWLFALN